MNEMKIFSQLKKNTHTQSIKGSLTPVRKNIKKSASNYSLINHYIQTMEWSVFEKKKKPINLSRYPLNNHYIQIMNKNFL